VEVEVVHLLEVEVAHLPEVARLLEVEVVHLLEAVHLLEVAHLLKESCEFSSRLEVH